MGDVFLETGSSYISAVDWVIPTTFGLLIDLSLLIEQSETGNSIAPPIFKMAAAASQ